jgi:acetyl-CoA acetyltransferase
MREVAVVSYAQTATRRDETRNEVEILLPVLAEAMTPTGLTTHDIGFTCSGSSDYLAGQAFAFVSALDAVGPWPPIQESHVEMDGAWALYEAWVRLQHGDIDTALVYAFGKSSPGDVARVLSLQLDPYVVGPLWPDAVSMAALQARALLDAGTSEKDLARVVARSRRNALGNPHAQLSGSVDEAALLEEPMYADPLRKHDCPPISDGAAVIVLAAGDKARELCERPAWIRGIDHRIDVQALGSRDLATSASTRLAGEKAGVAAGDIDLAELHAPFSHQELILAEALGLDEDRTSINPSGGALASNPVMVAGLVRIGEAARRISAGEGDRAVAHATSGPALQQNLVCVLEGGS